MSSVIDRSPHEIERSAALQPEVFDARVKFIIFLHIMKSGGMTLQRMLRAHYGPTPARRAGRFLLRTLRIDRSSPGSLADAMRAKTMRDRFMAGHFCFGAHELLPSPATYITLLRKPYERLVSLYYYSKHTPDAFYHHIARDITLRHFLLETTLHELDNGQLRFIVGSSTDRFMNRAPFGKCTLDMLVTAKRNLDQWFCLAGVTERFDESMLLLRRSLGWRSCYYLRRNEGRPVPHDQQLSDDDVAEIKRRNELDQMLYDYVVGRMDERIAAVQSAGEDFTAELAQFRARNARYNRLATPVYDVYERCKLGAKWLLGYRGYHA